MGHDSKYASHRFVPEQPRGLLHRAFSVFLFNADDKLLCSNAAPRSFRRWDQPCCSPRCRYEPTEVDTPEGSRTAASSARSAVPKLKHELGIGPSRSRSISFDTSRGCTTAPPMNSRRISPSREARGGTRWYILFIKPRKR